MIFDSFKKKKKKKKKKSNKKPYQSFFTGRLPLNGKHVYFDSPTFKDDIFIIYLVLFKPATTFIYIYKPEKTVSLLVLEDQNYHASKQATKQIEINY
jgi:hypothetical protein